MSPNELGYGQDVHNGTGMNNGCFGLRLGNLGAKPGDRLIKLLSPNFPYLPKSPNFGDLRIRAVRG